MKKSIFIVGIFIAMGVGFGFMSHYNASDGNVYFKNYNPENTNEIISNQANSVAFDNSGDVAYTAGDHSSTPNDDGNGLTIGLKNINGTFTFNNYNTEKDSNNFKSDNGTAVAFDNSGNVAYASENSVNTDPAIVLGIRHADAKGLVSYTFQTLGTANGITNNNGIGIAFDGNGDIAYATKNGFFIGSISNGEYAFTQYEAGYTKIKSISMDSKGDIAYSTKSTSTTDNRGGLNIGIKNQDTGAYTFKNYKPSFNEAPWSYSCALSKDGKNVAYTVQSTKNNGQDGELGVGTLKKDSETADHPYGNFNYYGTEENGKSGISTSAGRAVTFDSNDNIGYATKNDDGKSDSRGGLSIGKKSTDSNGKITYSFKQYNVDNTSGITNNYGSSVAFDNNGNIGYTALNGSLSISCLSVNIDPNIIIYDKRSDGNYNISALPLNFNSLLGDYFLNNQYVKIAITDNNNIYAAYFTKDNKRPKDSISYQQTATFSYPKDFTYSLKDISGKNGFEANENIVITILAGSEESNLVVLNTYNATVTGNSSNLALELGLGLGIGIPIVLISAGGVIYYFQFKKEKKTK